MNEFYREYLDAYVDRSGTHCEKWDGCGEKFGRGDVLPMWVADMDFRTVPAVSEALMERARHAVYGYTANAREEKAAEAGWLKRRYNLDVETDWILYSPGVVDSIFFCVRALTEKGDKILIQPPVYGPFYRAIEIFERESTKTLWIRFSGSKREHNKKLTFRSVPRPSIKAVTAKMCMHFCFLRQKGLQIQLRTSVYAYEFADPFFLSCSLFAALFVGCFMQKLIC